MAGKPTSFLIDTGATYSAMPAYSGKTKVSQVSLMGVDGLISTPRITEPLPCTLQNTPFSHSFLILPKCPTPILGRDLLSKFEASVTIPSPRSDLAWLPLLNPTFYSPAPLPSSSLNLIVWDTDNPSVASHHAPIHICLKDPSKFPQSTTIPHHPKTSTRVKAYSH